VSGLTRVFLYMYAKDMSNRIRDEAKAPERLEYCSVVLRL